MVSVQAEDCAPIVRAFEQGAERSEMWPNARTVADGLRVPRAIGDFLVLRAVRESGGTALAVTDADMVGGMRELGAKEGISAAPEGGAALTALKVLLTRGDVKPDRHRRPLQHRRRAEVSRRLEPVRLKAEATEPPHSEIRSFRLQAERSYSFITNAHSVSPAPTTTYCWPSSS